MSGSLAPVRKQKPNAPKASRLERKDSDSRRGGAPTDICGLCSLWRAWARRPSTTLRRPNNAAKQASESKPWLNTTNRKNRSAYKRDCLAISDDSVMFNDSTHTSST